MKDKVRCFACLDERQVMSPRFFTDVGIIKIKDFRRLNRREIEEAKSKCMESIKTCLAQQNYVLPELEVLEIAVEKGFAASGYIGGNEGLDVEDGLWD